jgi:hypothetical protein
MTVRRRSIGDRDQRASAFSAALMRLCDSVGALGAAVVDAEGETVDYAGSLDPFDIKVAAAEWQLIFALLRASRVPSLVTTELVRVRAAKKSFVLHALSAEYTLVVQLVRRSFATSHRAIAEAIREVSLEAALPIPRAFVGQKEQWCRVEVRCEDEAQRRPSAVWLHGSWLAVEVLGRFTRELGSHEIGYRARLASGAELTLIRERLGRWYTDGPVSG